MFQTRASGIHVSSAPPISECPSRVLVVSPDSARQAQLVELVEADGYEALTLRDPDELLRVVAEYEPDLVLIDAEQREGSGIEVCGELKATDPKRHVPAILVSWEHIEDQTVAAGLLAGADDFIEDPLRQTVFSARIRVQLRIKRHVDVLNRVRSERDLLRRDAECDPLTGIWNRRALERSAMERVDRRERFGVLFVDGDRFKLINDRHGHLVGDRVLVMIAESLKAGLRPGDAVGRYGGEEFVALVAGAGPEAARLVAERLRKTIEELEPPRPGPRRVTVSIGTAVFDPRSLEDLQGVFRRADLALYAAKRTGRNRVVMHSPDCEAIVAEPTLPPNAEPTSSAPPMPQANRAGTR